MKFLILGGGPAGLAVANRLIQNGETDVQILEAEKEAGGLCRSADVDGSPLDIGGGHFLDVRRPEVNQFLFQFMPEHEWDKYDRDSRIAIYGSYIGHPFEANIWQMDVDNQVEYLKSIAAAGCNRGQEKPNDFVNWIYWKLGDKIAEEYMIPYNQKMFGENLNQLGTYWMEKLPNVSFEDTLKSCIMQKAYGQQPGHSQFYYPKKYGYGELWSRMAGALEDRIKYNKHISGIDFDNHTITTNDGDVYQGDVIITTIPWIEFKNIQGMPEGMKDSISELKYSSIEIKYHPENLNSEAHWIYYPEPHISHHRILLRHNFCPNSKGYWTETNTDRVEITDDQDNFKFVNKYAYPLNTIKKPEIMNRLLTWSAEKKFMV